MINDFRRLETLIRGLSEIANSSSDFRLRMSKVLGAQAVKLISDGFRKSVDPYGNAWQPVKHRKRGDARNAKPLLDTGRMRNAFSAQQTETAFQITNRTAYVEFHQDGTSHIPRRQMVPEPSTGGVGPIWGDALNRQADQVMRAHMAAK